MSGLDQPGDWDFLSRFDMEALHTEGAPGRLHMLMGDQGFQLFLAKQVSERQANHMFTHRQLWQKRLLQYLLFLAVVLTPALAIGLWRWAL